MPFNSHTQRQKRMCCAHPNRIWLPMNLYMISYCCKSEETKISFTTPCYANAIANAIRGIWMMKYFMYACIICIHYFSFNHFIPWYYLFFFYSCFIDVTGKDICNLFEHIHFFSIFCLCCFMRQENSATEKNWLHINRICYCARIELILFIIDVIFLIHNIFRYGNYIRMLMNVIIYCLCTASFNVYFLLLYFAINKNKQNMNISEINANCDDDAFYRWSEHTLLLFLFFLFIGYAVWYACMHGPGMMSWIDMNFLENNTHWCMIGYFIRREGVWVDSSVHTSIILTFFQISSALLNSNITEPFWRLTNNTKKKYNNHKSSSIIDPSYASNQ